MRMNYENLDFEILDRFYTVKSKELEENLLSGVSWEEMRIKRMQLAELSNAAMNTKLYHPSEDAPQRNNDSD